MLNSRLSSHALDALPRYPLTYLSDVGKEKEKFREVLSADYYTIVRGKFNFFNM